MSKYQKMRSPGLQWWPASMSFVLLTSMLMAGTLSRGWAQVPANCKTLAVSQEIDRLEKEFHYLSARLDRAKETQKEDRQRLEICVSQNRLHREVCNGAQDAAASSNGAVSKIQDSVNELVGKLVALNKLPECPQQPTPPRPSPPPGGSGGTTPPLGGGTATHRTTSCPTCQPVAARLNQAADNYTSAIRAHNPDQTVFRQQMSQYSRELDTCERQCLAPANPGPGLTVLREPPAAAMPPRR